MARRPDPAAQLMQDLRKGSLERLYLFHGRERFLLQRAREKVIALATAKGPKSFNYQVFRGGADPEKVMAAARSLPMMAPLRMVVVEGVDQLKADQLEAYLPYLEKPSPSTVLLCTAKKADGRRKFYKRFAKHGLSVQFKPIYRDRDVIRWIEDETRTLGKSIDGDAARLLCELVGNSLAELHNELAKLATYTGEQNHIRMADLEAVVSDVKLSTVFELTDAIGERKPDRAMLLLSRLLGSGARPLSISAMLARHLRQLLLLREGQARGMPEKEAATLAGINPKMVWKIAPQARNYRTEELRRGLRQMAMLDGDLKGSKVPGGLLVERAVLAVLRGAQPRSFSAY